MRLEGGSRPLRAQLSKAGEPQVYHDGRKVTPANVRYTTFARQTGATPSVTSLSLRASGSRRASGQERDDVPFSVFR
jgi:hypothetical protein